MSEDTKIRPLLTWRSAICDSGLPATARHVALTLSLWMNERAASAFPGAATLAHATGLSERAVRDNLRLLVEREWLVLVERGGIKGERRRANHYRASNPGTSFTHAAGSPVNETTATPAPDDADPGTSCTPSLQELHKNSEPDASQEEIERTEADLEAGARALQAMRARHGFVKRTEDAS